MVEYWYSAFVSPFDIMMVISYQYPLVVPEQTDGDMKGALYTVSYVTDTGDASMSYESSSSQTAVDIHGVEVLCQLTKFIFCTFGRCYFYLVIAFCNLFCGF